MYAIFLWILIGGIIILEFYKGKIQIRNQRKIKKFFDDGMWVINKVFLDCVTALKCKFLLVNATYKYYDKEVQKQKIEFEGIFYARELENINRVKKYNWENQYKDNEKTI